MARTHAQQFANHTLVGHVHANPLAFMRAITNDAAGALGAIWEQAGADLPPIARISGTGFTVKSESQNRYMIAVIELPAPRVSGDPVAVAIIGRGDGTTKLGTIAYYTLELAHDATTGAVSFGIFSFTAPDVRVRACDGPLPDVRWFAEHVSELYSGQLPGARDGVPTFPVWYWWYAFDGAGAFKLFNEARDDSARLEAIRRAPILLLPEIIATVEILSGTTYADRLREKRKTVSRDPAFAEAWLAAVTQLVTTRTAGHPITNIWLALPLIGDAAEGAFTTAQTYDLEAKTFAKLASLGVDPEANYLRSEQLFAAAHDAANPRAKRASIAPGPPLDPTGQPLFLDEVDLPDHVPTDRNGTFASADPTFLAHGGLHAGYVSWSGGESSGMARILDARWVFRTATAATYFLHAVAPVIGEQLPRIGAPTIGDETLAFGDDSGLVRRSQVLAVRVGRIVIRLQATEGAEAAAARQILHAQMVYPLAGRAVKRATRALLAYWLVVEYPTNTIATLVHTPGHDVARLLPKYPLLAHPELPEAIRLRAEEREVVGGKDAAKDAAAYGVAADTLRNFQTQVRAHRFAAYAKTMGALTRALLATDMGDPRVNAAYAHEIVSELRHLDPDPVWAELDALCRARS